MSNAVVHILGVFLSIMTTIAVLLLKNISRKIYEIDQKLFNHLTNDELHSPRSMVAYKSECRIFQQFLERNLDDLKESVKEIFRLIDRKKGD